MLSGFIRSLRPPGWPFTNRRCSKQRTQTACQKGRSMCIAKAPIDGNMRLAHLSLDRAPHPRRLSDLHPLTTCPITSAKRAKASGRAAVQRSRQRSLAPETWNSIRTRSRGGDKFPTVCMVCGWRRHGGWGVEIFCLLTSDVFRCQFYEVLWLIAEGVADPTRRCPKGQLLRMRRVLFQHSPPHPEEPLHRKGVTKDQQRR